MPKVDKQPNSSRQYSRPWGVFAALLLGFVSLSAITWFGSQKYTNNIAEINTKDFALNWTHQVINEFGDKKKVFSSRALRINDKYTLKDFQKGTTVFRFRLIGDDGRVFWSSKFEEVGLVEKRPVFKNQTRQGKIVFVQQQMPAADVEGVSAISKTHSTIHKYDMSRLHDVAEVLLPIIDNKKFVGAISLMFDNTDLNLRSKAMATEIARVGIVAFAFVFTIVTIMIWSYGTERNKQNQSLRQAKQKAENAEQDAHGMAEQLQKTNDDVGKLNIELNKNMQIIRDTQNEIIRKGKMAQLGQLTATVAHDIRNPLGSIRTSAFLLRRKFAAANATMEKPLARIEKGVERCDGIITQLLDFARSKDVHLKDQNFDKWLLGLLREQAEQLPPELSFECTLGLSDAEYAFDSDNLARAIINFLSNASEAMVGKGPDKPENITANPTIQISTTVTKRGIEISVSDNGPGISKANMKKILDPLFTTKSFGVGLGLPAVEKVFEQHGGGMEVKSEEGNGATFTGWIAINKPDQEKSNAEAA